MLQIAVLRLRFHLEGCASLKDKRQRLSGLRDRFGRLPGIAVCESDAQDFLAEAEWSFVAAGGSRQITDRLVAEVESFVAESVDARVMARDLEYA
jgi:uncharacterized protein YlxP (DUF503 family)